MDFGNANIAGNGSLRGTIWHDVNIDGVRNTDPDTGEFTEPGLADWTVWVDVNANGVADPSESTLTDASGVYSFLSLPAGDYDVTEILPSGWDVSPDVRQPANRDHRSWHRDDCRGFRELQHSERLAPRHGLERSQSQRRA